MLAHFNQSNAAQMARMKRLGMYARCIHGT
jgi:hypothetical protein